MGKITLLDSAIRIPAARIDALRAHLRDHAIDFHIRPEDHTVDFRPYVDELEGERAESGDLILNDCGEYGVADRILDALASFVSPESTLAFMSGGQIGVVVFHDGTWEERPGRVVPVSDGSGA